MAVNLTPEQRKILEDAGLPAPKLHHSTRLRQQAKQGRPFAVISRSGRSYREANGRPYGEVDPSEQRQADAGAWPVGKAVREALEPITIAAAGLVKRIYPVRGWSKVEGSTKWVADLGEPLTNAELDAQYPDYPYRIGDLCPTRPRRAYRPEVY